MKFIGPQWQAQSSGGGSSSVSFIVPNSPSIITAYDDIVVSGNSSGANNSSISLTTNYTVDGNIFLPRNSPLALCLKLSAFCDNTLTSYDMYHDLLNKIIVIPLYTTGTTSGLYSYDYVNLTLPNNSTDCYIRFVLYNSSVKYKFLYLKGD